MNSAITKQQQQLFYIFKDFGAMLESLKWRLCENDDAVELCAHKHNIL